MIKRKPSHPAIVFFVLFFALIMPGISHAGAWWIFFEKEPGWMPGNSVQGEYIAAIDSLKLPIRTVSRYLNAVSVECSGSETAILESIPGVYKIKPVSSFERSVPEAEKGAASLAENVYKTADALSYGYSYKQLNLLDIPALHDKGLTGDGIVIGVLDSGFDIEIPESLKNVKIGARRNFITGTEDVSGHYHGAYVLGCMAGEKAGEYYGTAFGATYLLALTENEATETRADEDRWVAGIEWCDSLGADIVNSSLVYNIFDTPEESYTKDQMDGVTSLVAQAAEIAFSRGILVVCSAGNEGGNSWGIITTPADAEHVLAVGAVDMPENGTPQIAIFSSRGPTADNRIKPDVVAPGVGVTIPNPYAADSYVAANGTSYASPLVAGACALILESRPEWKRNPASVIEAMKNTAADLGDNGPDNNYGWGLADFTAAEAYGPVSVGGNSGEIGKTPVPFTLGTPFPNPFNASVSIPLNVTGDTKLKIRIYNPAGQLAETLFDSAVSPGVHVFTWNASGFGSGSYLIKVSSAGNSFTKKITLLK